ncbi:hypothetical protein [Flavobacterium panacagri]|uniref:hypothetical protein n=1 Tax=Flavobacterium panacagri TaxID=3034146 RepID=UPI0025A4FE1B|nr:hypothetical protein [Flavobacterium panacagri]
MKKDQDIIQVTITKPKLYQHKMMLKIGDWKKHFDLNYVKTIIAIALNHYTKNNSFFINGYLITNQNLYLIVQTNEKTIEVIIKKIEAQIILLLKFNPQKIKEKPDKIAFIADDESVFYPAWKTLFKSYPLENDYLVKLITGKKVTLPYFDQNLESIKTIIHNQAFCSSINYLGGIGPVEVTPTTD